MKYIFIILIFILSLSSVNAMPIVASEYNLSFNHQEFLEIVQSVPVKYYENVDWIEFVSEDKWGFGDYVGYYLIEYLYSCSNSRIYILVVDDRDEAYGMIKTNLIHELGHIYLRCVLKSYYDSEIFARNFEQNYNISFELGKHRWYDG